MAESGIGRPLWRPAGGEPPRVGSAEALGLAALLATAAALRLAGLGSDLWLDEVETLLDFVRRPVGEILTQYRDDNNHLLYTVLARLGVVALGESAFALRLPAAVFGVASVWALWRFARLVAGRDEALLAAALLTFSYHHVWFSQNARGYTGLLFGTTLATECLLRAMGTNRFAWWAGYAATVALTLWIHLTAIFVVAAHAAVVAFRLIQRGAARDVWIAATGGFVLAGALTLALYAPVLPELVGYYLDPPQTGAVSAAEWKSPVWLILETVRVLAAGFPLGLVGLLGAAVVAGTGLWRWVRADGVVTALFLLPGVVGALVLVGLGRNLWPRFFFHEAGFAVLIAVGGATTLGAWIGRAVGRPQAVGLAAGIAMVLVSATTLPRVYRHPKQDFTGARDFVAARAEAGDRVVVLGLATGPYLRYYAPDWDAAASIDDLERLRRESRRTWVVYTLPAQLEEAEPDLMQLVEREYEVVRVFPGTLGGGAMIVRRSRTDEG